MEHTDIYGMLLHSVIQVDNWIIFRVPGGWLYSFTDFNLQPPDEFGNQENNNRTHTVFVPITQQTKEEQMEGLLTI